MLNFFFITELKHVVELLDEFRYSMYNGVRLPTSCTDRTPLAVQGREGTTHRSELWCDVYIHTASALQHLHLRALTMSPTLIQPRPRLRAAALVLALGALPRAASLPTSPQPIAAWATLGPFPVGKNELDGQPLHDQADGPRRCAHSASMWHDTRAPRLTVCRQPFAQYIR